MNGERNRLGSVEARWNDYVGTAAADLDVMVEDLAAATPRVLELGATKLDGEGVFADPAGHNFGLVKRPGWADPIPDDAGTDQDRAVRPQSVSQRDASGQP